MIEPGLDRIPEHLRLATLWIVGTTAGTATGSVLCHMLLGDGPEGVSFIVAMPVLMGAAMGIGQWLALRKAVSLSHLWILCAIAGWLLAPFFYFHPSRSSFGGEDEWRSMSVYFRWPLVAVPSAGAFAGIGAGIVQAMCFPKIVRSRALWVIGSSAGCFFGGLMALLLGHPLFSLFYDVRSSLYGSPVRDVLEAALPLAEPLWYGAVLGLFASVATAVPLARPAATEARGETITRDGGVSPSPATAQAVPPPEVGADRPSAENQAQPLASSHA